MNNENSSYVFKVNLGGMIDILSNHLYSSPDVYIRELLQNGTDAISAKAEKNGDNKIEIVLTHENGAATLKFCDSGTGLTNDEIHRFLAVIGQSSKHNADLQKENNDYIGRFGIGLLSAFLVSDEIVVRTRSQKTPEVSLEWRGEPDGTYTIKPCEPLPDFGTQVILTPKKGAEEYFKADKITKLVQYYGMPLPYPIYLIETGGESVRLNPPLPSTGNVHQQIMDLGKMMFESDFLDYIPLESKSGLFSGAAFILASEIAPTAKQQHRIYLKNMLLTEDGARLLPKWGFFLRCFINTNGLRPTASREDFYEDDKLMAAKEELSDCIISYMENLSKTNPKLFGKIVKVHRLAVSSVAVEDDSLYRAFFPYFTFETSFGTMTGRDLLEYSGEITFTDYVDEFRQVSSLFLARGKILVNAGYTYVKKLLERMTLLKAQSTVVKLKINSIDNMLYDPGCFDDKTIRDFEKRCKKILKDYDCEVSAKTFEPEELPVLFTVNEDALLLRDIKKSMEVSNDLFGNMLNSFAGEYTNDAVARLYVNCDNPLIKRLVGLEDTEKLKCCIEILYIQALLTGGYPMHRGEMSLLNENLLQLLDWSI